MDNWGETIAVEEQIDSWQQELVSVESEIGRLRYRQVELIRRLDRYQVDTAEGARTMGDWAAAHLDVSRQTATRLTQLAHHPDPEIEAAMAEGKWGLDRAAALTKLRGAGIDPALFTEVAGEYSLGRLYGLLDRLRHVTPTDEEDAYDSRFLVIQPNLDESVYQLWGRLPGVDGRTIEKALSARETELPVLPDGGSQGQRRADALTTICLDSLTGSSGEEGEPQRAVTVAEVFIDGPLAAETYGEAGAGIATGPRVGPNTLSEILCDGKIRVIVTDGLHPVAYSDLGEAIPPGIRSYVLYRDQGQCSIEGCGSRYRLQPHHLRQRAHGGNHHPSNLITLCWYHHHVAIHQMGFRIDPTVPPTGEDSSPNTTPGHPPVGSNRQSGPTRNTHRTETNADPHRSHRLQLLQERLAGSLLTRSPQSHHRPAHFVDDSRHQAQTRSTDLITGSTPALTDNGGVPRILLSLILVVAACGTGDSPQPITPPLPEIDLARFQQLLAELDQPAIVNVWASWCLPCRAEAPLFQAAHTQHGQEIAFLGIDYNDSQRGARLFLDEFDLPFPHYFDPDGATIAEYGGIGVPRTYFFTSEAQLIYTHNGAIDEATLALHIDELLNR